MGKLSGTGPSRFTLHHQRINDLRKLIPRSLWPAVDYEAPDPPVDYEEKLEVELGDVYETMYGKEFLGIAIDV
jgi:hypothetical protein